jgi:hypothetical protein
MGLERSSKRTVVPVPPGTERHQLCSVLATGRVTCSSSSSVKFVRVRLSASIYLFALCVCVRRRRRERERGEELSTRDWLNDNMGQEMIGLFVCFFCQTGFVDWL